jgi:hypothetical protein
MLQVIWAHVPSWAQRAVQVLEFLIHFRVRGDGLSDLSPNQFSITPAEPMHRNAQGRLA